jgi:hypothetical protein
MMQEKERIIVSYNKVAISATTPYEFLMTNLPQVARGQPFLFFITNT